MLVAGHEIEIIDPNELNLGDLRQLNRFLKRMNGIGELDGSKLTELDETEKAIAVIMMSLAQQIDGCGIDGDTWDKAQSVTVAQLNALVGGRENPSHPEPTGRTVELTGELQAEAMLTPTNAGS
jgi:hypothetical protein